MTHPPQPSKLLTIGGSDSGGAAGVQADLKTWAALGAYGMSALTAVTAQSSVQVDAVHFLPPEFVGAQIDSVLDDYGAAAVKTGFIGRAQTIEVIARRLRENEPRHLVVDPVLVSHKGEAMFPEEVLVAYRSQLLPLAELITPNWREAALLAGLDPAIVQIQKAIDLLHAAGARHVLITGLHVEEECLDTYSDGTQLQEFPHPWIETENTHGSGDTLSAAICAFLARELDLAQAITSAQAFTSRALSGARHWRLGAGHGPLNHHLP